MEMDLIAVEDILIHIVKPGGMRWEDLIECLIVYSFQRDSTPDNIVQENHEFLGHDGRCGALESTDELLHENGIDLLYPVILVSIDHQQILEELRCQTKLYELLVEWDPIDISFNVVYLIDEDG